MKFTECCGKPVESYKESLESGYYVEGPVPATGDSYCQRCKRDVTRAGDVKNTPRNADIDVNGNWNYELKQHGDNTQP